MYTSVPRTILWLIPGGEHECLDVEGREPGELIEVDPFYLGKYPVTNEQMEAFDPAFDRSPDSMEDHGPALGVSFEDAMEYCRWYAEVSRKPMRLPTEAEWEYACCGGVDGVRQPDLAEVDAMAWHEGNSFQGFGRLDQKRANGFGLYGMLGAAWEWVAAPIGTPAAVEVVARGGSWKEPLEKISPSSRRVLPVGQITQVDSAFRVAKSLR